MPEEHHASAGATATRRRPHRVPSIAAADPRIAPFYRLGGRSSPSPGLHAAGHTSSSSSTLHTTTTTAGSSSHCQGRDLPASASPASFFAPNPATPAAPLLALGWNSRTADAEAVLLAYSGLTDPHLASFCATRRTLLTNAGLVTRKGTLTRTNVALSKVLLAERILANVVHHTEQVEQELKLEARVAGQRRCEHKLLLAVQAEKLRARLRLRMDRDAKRAATVSPQLTVEDWDR
jgi:hypothetical protein